MDTGKVRKTPKAFRLSDGGEALLVELSERLGIKQTAVVELAIRRMAAAEGLGQQRRESDAAAA